MSWSRFAIAATCIGSMKRCVQLAARFGTRRSIATGRVIDHPVIRTWLGEALAMIATAEGLLYRVAEQLDAGEGVPAEILAACKVLGSEFLGCTSDRLVQVLASRGYDEANEAPQLLRDARVTRIFAGATEPLVAFVGAAALSPRSDLYAFLRGELAAPGAADDLAAAVAALRARKVPGGGALPRPFECALAGWAGLWALVRGVAEGSLRQGSSPERERIAAWALRRFAEAAFRAGKATQTELFLLDPGELEKAVAGLADTIGDVDQMLPGGREERDPLLRREPPRG